MTMLMQEIDRYCYIRFFGELNGAYDFSDAPAFRSEITGSSKPMGISLFAKGGVPEAILIEIGGVTEEDDLEPFGQLIHSLCEHMRLVLTVTVSPFLQYHPVVMATYLKAGMAQASIDTSTIYKEIQEPNWTGIKGVFNETSGIRSLFGYFAVGCNEAIPFQFRFLSLFMIIERLFKKSNVWDKASRDQILDQHHAALTPAGWQGSTFAYLSNIRDKCAHPWIGSKGAEGTHSLSAHGNMEIGVVLHGLIKLCSDLLMSKSAVQLLATSEPPSEDAVKLIVG